MGLAFVDCLLSQELITVPQSLACHMFGLNSRHFEDCVVRLWVLLKCSFLLLLFSQAASPVLPYNGPNIRAVFKTSAVLLWTPRKHYLGLSLGLEHWLLLRHRSQSLWICPPHAHYGARLGLVLIHAQNEGIPLSSSGFSGILLWQ